MFTLIFGILLLVFGLFTIYLRVFKESKGLGKLDRMKQVYGDKIGTLMHVISYTVVPILLGVAGIIAYFLGVEIF